LRAKKPTLPGCVLSVHPHSVPGSGSVLTPRVVPGQVVV